MGGKGKKRRQKNYEASHGGGHTRLPPPPDPSSLDKMPSKLKQLMSFAAAAGRAPKKSNTDTDSKSNSSVVKEGNSSGVKRKLDDLIEIADKKKKGRHDTATDKKKKKNKRNKAEDLRFVTADQVAPAGTKRKERRKLRLEAKKKKGKASTSEDEKDFRGHEDIKFGDVVQAPPKLNTVPKSFKSTQNASQERLRLQAVEAYRKRKGWVARPGFQLPGPVTASPFG